MDNENKEFYEILNLIRVSKGIAVRVLFEELEKKNKKISKYREDIIFLVESFLAKLPDDANEALNKNKLVDDEIQEYRDFCLVNLYLFSSVFLKNYKRYDNFIRTNAISLKLIKRFNTTRLSIHAIFQGFLNRKPTDKFDSTLFVAEQELKNIDYYLIKDEYSGLKSKHDGITKYVIDAMVENGESEFSRLTRENEKLRRDNEVINNQLATANNVALILRDKSKKMNLDYRNMTEIEWRRIIDENRKNNGGINYTKIGRILGIHHTTVRNNIKKKGLLNY
ncbi:MAG: hypothetical protein AB7W47_12110 [Calditrichaceae bacterium]